MTSTGFVDFTKVKESVPIDRAVALLNLQMKQQGPQWRSACPACRSGGDRALTVNIEKKSYYCFAQGKGGDVIAFTAHVRGMTQRDAASWLQGNGSNSTVPHSTVRNDSPSPDPQGKEQPPLDYLVFNEAVGGMGLSEATCTTFGAGYAPRGTMRGRFAIPLHDAKGGYIRNITGHVQYVGVAMTEEKSPRLLFANGFDPSAFIFNAHNIVAGDLYIVHDPLKVLTAYESQQTNVVAVFTDGLTPQLHEQISALMDDRQCEHSHWF